MPAPRAYDVLLTGYRNDLARARTLRHLAAEVGQAREEPLPRLLYSGLDAATAEEVRRELTRLGAQVTVTPVAVQPVEASRAPHPATTAWRWSGLVATLLVGLGTVLAITWMAGQRQEQRRLAEPGAAHRVSRNPAARIALEVREPAVEAVDSSAHDAPNPRAVELNNQAIALARQRDYAAAVQKLRSAVALDPVATILKNNLQAVLVTWSVALLEADDLSYALDRIEEADALGDQIDAVYTLGVIHLRRSDLGAARAALERALDIAPHDGRVLVALAELYHQLDERPESLAMLQRARESGVRSSELDRRIDQLAREVDAEWDFVEHTSAHFRISFAGDEDATAVQTVLHAMEDAYDAVGAKLNHYLDERVAVVLYTEKDFHEITRTPDWAGGAFDGRIKLPVRGLDAEDAAQLARVTRHELAHALVHELTAGRCPVWLNEGIAVWAEEWRDGERLDWAETALSQQRPFRFAQLAGTFTSLSAGDAELAYAQSYLAVRALVERYGTQGLIDLLKALRTQPLAEAFATALRDNLALFEQRFLREHGT
jgi:tetratricopeptide (TPR) repeat protein